MWTIFRVFIKSVTILLLFYVLIFWQEPCGPLVPRPGIEPTRPAREGEFPTTGPPGKFPVPVLLKLPILKGDNNIHLLSIAFNIWML